MYKLLLSVTTLVLVLAHWADGSNILVIFSSPSRSHNVLGVKLAEGLVKAGHHVTFVNPFPSQKMENLTIVEVESIKTFFTNLMSGKDDKVMENSIMGNIRRMKLMLSKPNELLWEEPIVKKWIKEKPKFDLLISLIFFNDAILGLGHHLGIPTIIFNCVGTFPIWNNFVANPTMVYSINPIAGLATDSFLGRLGTAAANFAMGAVDILLVAPFHQELLTKIFPGAPTLEELRKNVSLVLASSHYSIEPPRPYVPNMIQIGGYHVQNVKPLPQEFKTFMDSAKAGAILFSLGGNVQVSMLNESAREAIFKVLGEMSPIKVVFKSEMEHKNVPKNIMVRQWVPQADILAHPNTKLFISHGGWGGVTESAYHGVPILGVPFVGDQAGNLRQAQAAGWSRILRPASITEDTFRNELKEMLSNPKYAHSVKSRSALMKDQPVKPMETALFWIEHVIKFGGGQHLQNDGVRLAWYQLYMIDIYIFVTVVLVLLTVFNIYAFKFTIRLLKKLFSRKAETKGKKKEKKH